MRDIFGQDTVLGYCTNVHAGVTCDAMVSNLARFSVAVKERICPKPPMGIGLWLADEVARELIDGQRIDELKDRLGELGLFVFTLNGFPFGNFHQPIVKHRVYEPSWADEQRLDYTVRLARILAQLTDGESEAGISTLPLGWPGDGKGSPQWLGACAGQLLQVVDALSRIEAHTGRLIHVDIEPEPGCVLDTADDVAAFFKEYLFVQGDDEKVRRHVRVCHDICHSAVMFESQAQALRIYREAGIAIGKVQVSNAVRVKLDRDNAEDAIRQLGGFDEPRYLHQTMLRDSSGGRELYEDLKPALEHIRDDTVELRTHFHVPLFVEKFGQLDTTQDEVLECLRVIRQWSDCRHFEAETYAWDVLPASLRCEDLAHGIAQELAWLCTQAQANTTGSL